jgi:hypothetical protein
MKLAATLPLVLACLGAQTTPQTARFGGVVLDSLTGEPLAGVHVKLFTLTYDLSPSLAYGAISTRDGHFSMGAIQPGAYRLAADLRGFSNTAEPAVTLRLGQHIADFKLEMARQAVIAGRVVDENGDPVADVPVAVLLRTKDTLSVNGASYDARSDDRGEFRWSGPPGKYYLRADPDSPDASSPPEIRTDGTKLPVYGITYVSGAVTSEAGKTLSVEIRLQRQRAFAISGFVTGVPEGASPSPSVILSGDDRRDTQNPASDGSFLLTNLPAGDYLIYAEYRAGQFKLQSPIFDLRLEDADKTNLALDLTPGGDLAGALAIVGGPPLQEKIAVRLDPVKGAYLSLPTELENDGSFRFERVPRDRFRVIVDPLPENTYIKSIQLDDSALTNGELDLTRGAQGSTLKIVVSRAGAQVTGTVRDSDGHRVLNSWDAVYLVADPNLIQLSDRALIDPEGNFAFKGIRPGRYRLFAAADPFDDDVLKKLAQAAESLSIHEGDRIARDLKLPDNVARDNNDRKH